MDKCKCIGNGLKGWRIESIGLFVARTVMLMSKPRKKKRLYQCGTVGICFTKIKYIAKPNFRREKMIAMLIFIIVAALILIMLSVLEK